MRVGGCEKTVCNDNNNEKPLASYARVASRKIILMHPELSIITRALLFSW